MTKYTDDQINEAIQKAAEKNTAPPVYGWGFNMYKKVIDHLPDPQDEWEECDFEDIQKGDRVRMVQAARTTDFHLPVIETYSGLLVFQDNTQCSNFHEAVYYRIPAPVTHPDPDFHPVVISSVGDAWVWDDVDEHYIEIGGGGHRGPGDFGSGWVSGKVEAVNENS